MLARAAGDWRFAVGFLVGFAAIAAVAVLVARGGFGRTRRRAAPRPDRALLRVVLDATDEPAAITDRAGRLVAANAAYVDRFGPAATPPSLPGLDALCRGDRRRPVAPRGARAAPPPSSAPRGSRSAVTRAGVGEDHLLWRVGEGRGEGRTDALRLIGGGVRRPARARRADGGADRRARPRARRQPGVRACAPPAARAAAITGRDFAACLTQDEAGALRFVRDEAAADPLAAAPHPARRRRTGGRGRRDAAVRRAGAGRHRPPRARCPTISTACSACCRSGLALIDRDGRFLFLNEAFRAAAGVGEAEHPVYPSDIVVKEDKSAVSDAVRRFAASRPTSSPARSRPDAVGRHRDPPARARRRAGVAHRRLGARAGRGLGDPQPQGFGGGGQAPAPGRAGHQDAGGGAARGRRRARFQQHPDRGARPLRPDPDAPHPRRQRL